MDEVDRFLEGWASHGAPLRGSRDWRCGRLLLVGVDEGAAPPSGCSIDALVNALKSVEREMDVKLLDNAPVWFAAVGEVRAVSRTDFRRLAAEGRVGLDTEVFDNTLTRVGALRAGKWRVPARESWHRALVGG